MSKLFGANGVSQIEIAQSASPGPRVQGYARVANWAALGSREVGRFAQARQFKRMSREITFPRTRLGRIIMDIRRKTMGGLAGLQAG